MSDVEFLRNYRNQVKEVALLREQLEYVRYIPEHRHLLAQHTEQLRALLEQAEQRRAADGERFEAILRRAPNARIRLVLNQYYGWALTDEAVAESIGASVRAVSVLRKERRDPMPRKKPPLIAGREEVLQTFTSIMRGEMTEASLRRSGGDDQRILTPPKISERCNAAELLGKQ